MREDKQAAPPRKCPICGKPAVEKYRPFCSRRCADIDLNRWLSGGYAIPAAPDEDEDGAPAPRGPDED
ncbi:MAG: DNA gyrase inhibitor YacG [Beijerinckiaceae bacterium]